MGRKERGRGGSGGWRSWQHLTFTVKFSKSTPFTSRSTHSNVEKKLPAALQLFTDTLRSQENGGGGGGVAIIFQKLIAIFLTLSWNCIILLFFNWKSNSLLTAADNVRCGKYTDRIICSFWDKQLFMDYYLSEGSKLLSRCLNRCHDYCVIPSTKDAFFVSYNSNIVAFWIFKPHEKTKERLLCIA